MSWRVPVAAFGAALLLGGCSSTSYFTVKDITEDAVERLSFAAPTDEMDLLRARYIVAGIALYGVHSISEYSGEFRTADASRILNRTVEILRIQDEFGAVPTNRYFRQTVRRIETLTLVDAAVQPTKRYYRERLLNIFSGGPGAAVAAARTAFDALKNLAEVEVYRQAMLADARLHAIEIAVRSQAARTAAATALQSGIDNIRSVSCKPAAAKDAPPPPPPTLSAQVKADAEGTPRWWDDYLSKEALQRICDDQPLGSTERAYLTRAILATRPPTAAAPKFVTDADWERPNYLVAMACEELTRLAGLRQDLDPCKKYFEEAKRAAMPRPS